MYRRPSTRRTRAPLGVLLALGLTSGLARPAAAQFSADKILLDELDVNTGDVKRRLSETELKEYFNGARCDCANKLRITIEYQAGSNTDGNAKVKVVSGPTDCLTTEKKIDTGDCRILYDTTLTKLLDQTQKRVEISVPPSELMLRPSDDCAAAQEQTSFKIHVFTDQSQTEEFTSVGSITYTVDSDPPDSPVAGDGQPESGEELVEVSFSKPESGEQNLKYQILCQRVDAPEASPRKNADDAEYDVPATAENCTATLATDAGGTITFADVDGGTSDGGAADGGAADGSPGDGPLADAATPAADAGVTDAAAVDLGAADLEVGDDAVAASGGIAALEPRFICSGGLSSDGTVQIKGLENGVEYRFYAIAIDSTRNPSALVDLGTATPRLDEDLWERYKRSGGGASGCTLAPGGVAGALAVPGLLLGLWLLARRRRRRGVPGASLLIVGLVTALTATGARAEPVVDASDYRSPQNFAAEIKLGPYAPNIDSEFSSSPGPFERIFGDGESLMFRGEIDWQIWRGFGSVGIGLASGYYHNSANALLDNTGGSGGPSTSTETSAGTTTINLVPISLLAVYRFDVLADRWSIPLVPFVKFGLNYTIWWIEKGTGDLAEEDGDKALGGSLGLQLNAGLALRLDIFEPTAAKNLDTDIGINHTYAFFELVYQQADGFGAADKLDVGDTTWQAGLAFEF